MYKIFTLKNYKTKRDDPKIVITGDKNEIMQALTNDKGYHELLMDNIEYNLFYDIDKIPLDEDYLIYDFIELLSKISHYDITDTVLNIH